MTSHSRSYGEELQRSIFVQIASAIGDLESAIGIISSDFTRMAGERMNGISTRASMELTREIHKKLRGKI